MNSRRGASVIVSAILLIAVATASAMVLWSAFGAPSLPQSNVKAELEDIRIVKVTTGDGLVNVYVMNRGSTYATIDSIYLESIYGGLNQTVPIDPVTLAPGEIKQIQLPASFNNVVNLKAVTTEGKQTNVLVLEPSSVQSPYTPPIFSSGSLNILPNAISNYDQWVYITNKSVQEIDAKFVSTFSSETIQNYTIKPPPSAIPGDAFNAELQPGGGNSPDVWLYDGPRENGALLYWSITYGGKIDSALVPTVLYMVLQLELQIDPTPNELEIRFYDWSINKYVDGGDGYYKVTIQDANTQRVAMLLKIEGNNFITPDGMYKYAINMTHLDKNNPNKSTVNVKMRSVSVISQIPSQEINPIFYFDLSSIYVPSISKLVFTFSGTFNASNIPLSFNLYNFTGSTWVKQADLFSNPTANNPTNIQLEIVNVNNLLSHYISSSKELRANLRALAINGSVYQLNIDQCRLEVVYG